MNILDRAPVADWLRRFDKAARAIPQPRRDALRSELTGHLFDALHDDADDAAVAEVLDQLGDPATIVADEVDAAAAIEVEPRPPLRRRRLAIAAIIIIVIAVLLAAVLPAVIGAVRFASAPKNVVNAHPQGPDRVTEGRAYEEYIAATTKLPPLPDGATWPDGVIPGMDAGSTDAGIVEAGNGVWTARFTWLCAWEDEYLLAEHASDDARLVAALDQLEWWPDQSWWRESDPAGAWEGRVLAPLRFADSGELKNDFPQSCAQANIFGVAATLRA